MPFFWIIVVPYEAVIPGSLFGKGEADEHFSWQLAAKNARNVNALVSCVELSKRKLNEVRIHIYFNTLADEEEFVKWLDSWIDLFIKAKIWETSHANWEEARAAHSV